MHNTYVVQSVQYKRSFAIAKPNGYVKSVATVLTVPRYGSIHSTLCVPASAKHNSPVGFDIASEFGKLIAGAVNSVKRFDPSKSACSIFGLARFQSDQYNLLNDKMKIY